MAASEVKDLDAARAKANAAEGQEPEDPEAAAAREAAEEAQRQAAEEAQAREDAIAQLSFPVGGTPASKFRVQVTGGAVELPASLAGKFQKDEEVEITVRGWVKTDKNTTEQKGGSAVREAVVVVEEIEPV